MKHFRGPGGRLCGFDLSDESQAPYMLKEAYPEFDLDGYFYGVNQVGLTPVTVAQAEQRLLSAGWVEVDSVEEVIDAKAAIRSEVTNAIQRHLDVIAQTRGYDGILSLCSYASDSEVLDDSIAEKFRREGNAAFRWRSKCWAALYRLEEDIKTGDIDEPATVEAAVQQAIDALPPIEWPQV